MHHTKKSRVYAGTCSLPGLAVKSEVRGSSERMVVGMHMERASRAQDCSNECDYTDKNESS